MRAEDILLPTPAGVWCKLGGFHIDPTRPVDKAVITHGHSDHARAGHGAVLATRETLRHDAAALRRRISPAPRRRSRYGEDVESAGRGSRFHPAGHVLGSAQVAVEASGLRIVVSGDYKRRRRSDLRAVRAGAVRRVHHRGDLRPAGVPPRDPDGRDRPAAALASRCSRSARIWSAPIRSARRSG